MGVFLLVIDVALVTLVEVMTWLGLTSKFVQGNIPTPLTTPIPIITCRTTLIPTLSTTLIPNQVNISAPLTPPIPTMFWPTMSPTLRLTLRPSLNPQKYFTPTLLVQLVSDDAKFGDQVGRSVSVFGGWSIFGAPNSNNTKGRAYLYKIFLGA